MKKLCAIITALSMFVAVPVLADVSVSQDGRLVTIEGTLAEKTQNQKITVTVRDSDDNIVYLGQTSCDEDGQYSIMFSPSDDEDQELEICVKAANQNLSEETVAFEYEETEENSVDSRPSTGGGRVVSIGSGYVPPQPAPVPDNSLQNTKWYSAYSGHWAYQDICALIDSKVLDADKAFNPDDNISRIEFVEFICKATGRKAEKYTCTFSDVDASDSKSLYLQAAVDDGIISVDTKFRPYDGISRQEMCKVLCIAGGFAYDEKPQIKFADEESFGDWALGYIYSAAKANLVNGKPDGIFDPMGSVTYSQATAVVNRMMSQQK